MYIFQSNILSEGGIENVILTSLTENKTFEYQGSEKGSQFLANKVGHIDTNDHLPGKS